MRKSLLMILAIVLTVSLSCGQKPGNGKPPGQQGDKGGRNGTTKGQLPKDDLFLYRWGSGDIGFLGTGASGETQLIVADVATGQEMGVYPMLPGKQILFSPDFTKILYIEETAETPSMIIRAVERESGKEIWATKLPSQGEGWTTRNTTVNWDIEKGYIILELIGFKVNRQPPENTQSAIEMTWWFLTIDSTTGDEIARLKVIDKAAVRAIPTETQVGAQYAAGELYLPLPDYPVTEFTTFDRTGANTGFDIYAVNPITGEGRKIDMKGMLGQPIEAKFFPTSDGSTMYIQTQQKSELGSPQLMGGSIQRIDLKTGKWELLLEYSANDAYNLRSMTPDGSKILYSHWLVDPDGAPYRENIVRDMSTGHETTITLDKAFNYIWLSPSGKYIITFAWVKERELKVIDVASGSERILDSAENGTFPYPLKFLGGLGNGM